jgi:hypothetical protein
VKIAVVADLHCVSRREIERELAELERHLARFSS